jgi:Rieske 2Fe-2S family protein
MVPAQDPEHAIVEKIRSQIKRVFRCVGMSFSHGNAAKKSLPHVFCTYLVSRHARITNAQPNLSQYTPGADCESAAGSNRDGGIMSSHQRLLELINARKPNHTLCTELYTNDEVYKQELELMWQREWIFVGHTFEIPKAGQYMSVQIGNHPIVIVRGDKGEVRAFHNTCRHRGSRVCTAEKGKVAKLVCPYHSWTYGLDGRLLYAPNMGENFDSSSHGLRSAHCETFNSYIYVCVAEEAPDFAAFRDMVSPYLAPYSLENCKVAYESNIVEAGNWKLVWENNRECYHCEPNHPELIKSYVESPAGSGLPDPGLDALWASCEAAGLPSRMQIADDYQYRITRLGLAENARSFTMDTQPAVNRRLDPTDLDQIGVVAHYHFPSTWNHALTDHAITFRVLPVSANETLLTTKWLVPADAVEGKDYDLQKLTEVWIATNEQDRRLVEDTHAGVSSPAYVPGPYSEVAEIGVRLFVDWYCSNMQRKLDQ